MSLLVERRSLPENKKILYTVRETSPKTSSLHEWIVLVGELRTNYIPYWRAYKGMSLYAENDLGHALIRASTRLRPSENDKNNKWDLVIEIIAVLRK